MKHQTVPLFALPLTRVDLDCGETAEFFDTVIKPSTKPSNAPHTGEHLDPLSHYYNDQNVFEIYDELKPLGETILSAANFVYQDVMNHDTHLRFTNAWFNECGVGGQQTMHNHCNSVISGTVYLRADDNSQIQFQSPYGLNDFGNLLLNEPNLYRPNRFGYSHHFNIATYKVATGACLFWPSHLRHGYTDNLTPNRLTLSFNFLPVTFNCIYKA